MLKTCGPAYTYKASMLTVGIQDWTDVTYLVPMCKNLSRNSPGTVRNQNEVSAVPAAATHSRRGRFGSRRGMDAPGGCPDIAAAAFGIRSPGNIDD